MARVVVLGAGLGGVIMAYELRTILGRGHDVAEVNQRTAHSFVPSVAVCWRQREAMEVDLATVFSKRDTRLHSQGAAGVHPAENRIELPDGRSVPYDYLVIATGPDLAFDEIEGFGPEGHTQSICHIDRALRTREAFDRLVAKPGPVVIDAAQGASYYGLAYEFAFVLDNALRDIWVRDLVPMTFVTAEPYIGHRGLDGVEDSETSLESKLRQQRIKRVCHARVGKVEADRMQVSEMSEDGSLRVSHELHFAFAMMLPAFRGVEAVRGIEGPTNPRGFVLADRHQRIPTVGNVFSVGVRVALPAVGKTPVPVGVPKTGFPIESMVAVTAHNIARLIAGQEPSAEATWNAACLADVGDGDVAFEAQPQIPLRNVNWSSSGKWVHGAKVGFERYSPYKFRGGKSEPFDEQLALKVLGIDKPKATRAAEVA